MINTVHLKNFKCFADKKFNFKPITILAGTNAVGKSSLIQAIVLYKDSLENKSIKLNKILGQEIGGPQRLISHNPIDLGQNSFYISVDNNIINYCVNKDQPVDLITDYSEIKKEDKINYLKAERIGPRARYEIGENEILSDGSNSAYLMELYDANGINLPDMLKPNHPITNKFSRYTEYWLSKILNNIQIENKIDSERSISELFFKNTIADKPVTPALTGFGISYTLPIVIACLICASQKNNIIIVENPEAHLHPAAQTRLGEFLAIVSSSGTQVIVETHSEHIIDGVRIKMTELKNTESCLINFFSVANDLINVEEITINEFGELSSWPKGFFDQKELDLERLFALWSNNENN